MEHTVLSICLLRTESNRKQFEKVPTKKIQMKKLSTLVVHYSHTIQMSILSLLSHYFITTILCSTSSIWQLSGSSKSLK